MSGQPILLVEDNDDDAELTVRAFAQAKVKNRIIRAQDGVEALDFLLRRGSHADRDLDDVPAVILLDLNLPRLHGLELLKRIRATEQIRHLPVVILTSSNDERDRLTAYDRYANSFVRKPVDYEQFVAASRQLGLYWLVLNEPPPGKESPQD